MENGDLEVGEMNKSSYGKESLQEEKEPCVGEGWAGFEMTGE